MLDSRSIREAALALPREDRAQLVESLLASLDDVEAGKIEDAWIEECDRRWEAYKKGELKTIPAEEVMQKLRAGQRP